MTRELFREDPYRHQVEAEVTSVTAEGIRLDRTVFYPTGGGQPGDVGMLIRDDGYRVCVSDTRKYAEGDILHIPDSGTTSLRSGDRVVASIDWDRRYRHMRMHTCLHLLCAVVGAGVTGGAIAADKGRLDFDLPESTLDKGFITQQLNQLIQRNIPATVRWITDAELAAQPDLVKTLSVQPPKGQGMIRLLEIAGVDLQPCGGTHVSRTAEIGPVKITKIEKKSRRNRRVTVTFDDQPRVGDAS